MIYRQYIVLLETARASNLDIIVGRPGSSVAPVASAIVYPAATITAAPAGWVGGAGMYYEVRGRSLPLEKVSGQAGFVPRTHLGYHLSIVALQNSAGTAVCQNLLPMLGLSASLAPAPGADNVTMFGAAYAAALADPAYGPVIRVYNTVLLYPGTAEPAALYLVSFGIAEAKNEDFTPFGRG